MRLGRSVLIAALLAAACAKESPAPAPPDVVAAVRQAITDKDLAGAARTLEAHGASGGVTPAVIEAHSLLAAGAFSAKSFDVAGTHARAAYDLGRAAVANRRVDPLNLLNIDPQVATAIGRAIEVLANLSVERGARSEAVAFLDRELATYRGTSVEKRVQKNINLLSLEGTEAPPLDVSESLGDASPALASLKSLRGRVVFMFFWAHWCADCKAQGPILAKLLAKYEPRGLTVVAPTQRFGYVAGGALAGPAVETPYIESVRAEHYPVLAGRPIPLSEANHRRYGVSSTPTLVLVDRRGLIRLYHPGKMTEEELDPILARLVAERVEGA